MLRNVTVRHYNNHWLYPPFTYKVIHYLSQSSKSKPGILILSRTVKQIKNRILFATTRIISCRSIDAHSSAVVERGRRVPHLCNRAVRYIFIYIVPGSFTVDNEDIIEGSAVSPKKYVVRIQNSLSCKTETVGINLRSKRTLRSVLPKAVLSLFHQPVALSARKEISVYKNGICLWRGKVEGNGIVLVYCRFRLRLLFLCKERNCCQQKYST